MWTHTYLPLKIVSVFEEGASQQDMNGSGSDFERERRPLLCRPSLLDIINEDSASEDLETGRENGDLYYSTTRHTQVREAV
jgi:hypothetical protein